MEVACNTALRVGFGPGSYFFLVRLRFLQRRDHCLCDELRCESGLAILLPVDVFIPSCLQQVPKVSLLD